jgi:hypothetical protein
MEKSIPQDGPDSQVYPLWDTPGYAGAREVQASSHCWRPTASTRCAVIHTRSEHSKHLWLAVATERHAAAGGLAWSEG